ncbi:Transposase IS4 [Popillia japonica]|uniref:Transposase IS4 n=1 Tax=Popillia japonica TaxID=7064 RepID=A0AAW1ITI7_POPJA
MASLPLAKKPLTEAELKEEVNKLFESDDDDDSVKDPDYSNSSSSESEEQDEPVEQDEDICENEVTVRANSCEPTSLIWSHNIQDVSKTQFTGNEVGAIVDNIQNVYIPGETVAIDESMILFRGRLKFRQYNPGKANKYGVKVYKLCTSKGFVWNLRIYCGNDPITEGLDKPGSVVVTLGDKLLNEGRLFITDNWYTSVPLALYLNQHNTNLCGTH